MPSFAEFKESLVRSLAGLFEQLDSDQKFQAAKDSGSSLPTLYRYCRGDIGEIRNPELAEKMIEAMKLLIEKPAENETAS